MTFDQEGQPPMVIHGINADIVPGDKSLTLTGEHHRPVLGKLEGPGRLRYGHGQKLHHARHRGRPRHDGEAAIHRLRAADGLGAVHVEGKTPAQVRLDMQTAGDKPTVHYRVEIAPRDARVQVPSIDLSATEAHGKAVIADEVVTLDDVQGKIAGGEITTSGNLDFRGDTSHLAFKVGVRDVMLARSAAQLEGAP